MQVRAQLLTCSIVLVLVLSPAIGLLDPTTARADAGDEGHLTPPGDTFQWDPEDVGTERVMNLSLSRHWTIEEAKLTIEGSAVDVDGKETYPHWPKMDIPGDGIDWELPGTMGQQTEFANQSETEVLSFSNDDTEYLYIPLPTGSEIQDVSFDVAKEESGQFEYKMYVGGSDQLVWQRNDIYFSEGIDIETQYEISAVCVDHMDFLFDNQRDIIGVGDGGSLYQVMHDSKTHDTVYSKPEKMVLGSGTPPPELLACTLVDYDHDIDTDVAVSSSDGKMYIVTNQGFGNLGDVMPISASTNRIESVTMGDLDDDGWFDIAGGYVAGKVYISYYNASSGEFSEVEEIDVGTGSIEGIQIEDLDRDTLDDIIVASSDGNWWYIRNQNGGGWGMPVPISSGSDGLTSLVVADLDDDDYPDLISGGHDGAIYVSINEIGAFGQGTSYNGGPRPMKEVVAGDLDSDDDIDILGLNADGHIYLVRNHFGTLTEKGPIMDLGMDINSIALGDMDNDKDLDLVSGGQNGFKIYWNDYGPFKASVGNDILRTEMQGYLDQFSGDGVMVEVPLRIFSQYPGNLKIDDLNVTYDLRAEVDMKEPVSNYIETNWKQANAEGYLDIPIVFTTKGPGFLKISDISIKYHEPFLVFITEPKDTDVLYENTTYTFRARTNEKVPAPPNDYEYIWTVDGWELDKGQEIEVKGNLLGAHAHHWLKCSVLKVSTRERSEMTILVKLEPNNPPEITGSKKKMATVDKEFRMKVKGKDPDPWDSGNLTYSLVEGPKDLVMDPYGIITWRPGESDVGEHKVIVNLTDGKESTNATYTLMVIKSGGIIRLPGPFDPTICLIGFIIGLAVLGFVLGGTEIGIYAFFSFLLFMYTRIKKEKVLDNFIRGRVFGHISENPGLRFTELKRKLNLPNGTLTYHLRTLEREGMIKSVVNGTYRVFFPGSYRIPKDFVKLSKAQRMILNVIREQPGISQKKITAETGLSRTTVNRIVHHLHGREIIRLEKGRRTKCYATTEEE
jgi:predicted transcriptional regulator